MKRKVRFWPHPTDSVLVRRIRLVYLLPLVAVAFLVGIMLDGWDEMWPDMKTFPADTLRYWKEGW